MPPDHGDNHSPEVSDHDHLIETMAAVRRLESDSALYRERYHDVVAPAVQRNISEVADIKRQLESMGQRLTVGEIAKAEIADHKDDCIQYHRSNERKLVEIDRKIEMKIDAVMSKMDAEAAARKSGRWSIIKWFAGLLFGGLGALLLALWQFVLPHIIHMPAQ